MGILVALLLATGVVLGVGVVGKREEQGGWYGYTPGVEPRVCTRMGTPGTVPCPVALEP